MSGIVIHSVNPRVKKKEKKRRFLSISRFFPESEKKKNFHSIPCHKYNALLRTRIKHTHEITSVGGIDRCRHVEKYVEADNDNSLLWRLVRIIGYI